MTDDTGKKQRVLPKVTLSPAESDWLKIVCARFRKGFATNVELLKKGLNQQGNWTPGFRPLWIDNRVLRNGNEPSLLGIWHADPDTDLIDKCDKLLKFIKQRLSESSSLSLKLREISIATAIPVNELSLLMRLLPDLGFGHKLTSVASQGTRVAIPDQLPIYESVTIDDPEWVDGYLSYDGIEEQIQQRFGDMIDIFISHSAEEKEIAFELQSFLRRLFGPTCRVFVSSEPGSMEPGDWFVDIVSSLKKSRVALVLVSEVSRVKPWLYYEAGVAEGIAMEADNNGFAKNVIPVVIGKLSKGEIPWPLAHYQAGNIHDQGDVKWILSHVARLIGRALPDTEIASLVDRITQLEVTLTAKQTSTDEELEWALLAEFQEKAKEGLVLKPQLDSTFFLGRIRFHSGFDF